MRILICLALAAALSAPAGLSSAEDNDGPALFDAGLVLGGAAGSRQLLASLAASPSAANELLAGIVAGMIGRDRLAALLEGSGAGRTAAAAPGKTGAPPPLPGSLAATGAESFWIRIGGQDAPAIYMFADPACPHCAAALDNLKLDISSGRLQVRLALAPVLSEASRELSAMIMLDPEPAQAAWSLLLAAAGGAPLPDVRGSASELGELGEALIDANLGFMRRRGLAAVPHFIWSENGRWREAAGVQASAIFASADRLGSSELSMHAPEHVRAMVETAAAPVQEELPPLPE